MKKNWRKITFFSCCSLISSSVLAEEPADYIEFNSSFLHGNIDVSRFAYGNPADPGNHLIDIYVNDQWKGQQRVQFEFPTPNSISATACYDTKLLLTLGLSIEKLAPHIQEQLKQGALCTPFDELVEGGTAIFDTGSQQLKITSPQIFMNNLVRGYVDPALWDHGITAGTLKYDYNAYHIEHDNMPSQTNQYLAFRGGVNWDVWRFRYNGSYSWGNNSDSHYTNNAIYLERDLISWRSKLTLGESSTDGQVFDSVNFLGLQLMSADQMYADAQRGFAPEVKGITNTTALVTVSQKDRIIYQTTVPPGPFVIDDLYPTGQGGELVVTIKEANGEERVFTVPYASITELLRPGVTRYSVMAGTYRNRSLSDDPFIMLGTIRHGFSNLFTGYTGGIVAEGYTAATLGVALNTQFGAFSTDITQAYTRAKGNMGEDQQGHSIKFSYAKTVTPTDTTFTLASYHYSNSGYYDIDSAMLMRDSGSQSSFNQKRWHQKNRFQLTASQQLPKNYGSVSLTASVQDYWKKDGTDSEYQLSYNNSFKYFSFNINAQRARNLDTSNWDNRLMLSVSIPLHFNSYRANFNSSYTQNRDSQALQNTISGSLGDDNQYSYSAFANSNHFDNASNTTSYGASASWAAPYSHISGSYSADKNYKQYSMNLSGGIVAYNQGIIFSPDLGDTIAIVEAKDANGARVSGYSGLRLGYNGKAVVPYLSPYRLNSIEVDPRGLSPDVELKETGQNIVPTAGSVSLVKFKTEHGYSILINGQLVDGSTIPFAASIFDINNQNVGYVAQGGQALIRVNEQRGSLRVEWGSDDEQNCQFSYQLETTEAASIDQFRRLNIICE